MKILRMLSVFAVLTLALIKSNAQNVNISISSPNAGIIKVGESLFLEAYVGNTSSSGTVGTYKLRPLFSFPSQVEVLTSGHQLPTGWVVLSNDGQNIRIGNGTGTIPPNTTRIFYIAIRGKVLGSSTISANLSFANGVSPGNTPGSGTPNNSTVDDNATAGIQTIPCTEPALAAPVVTSTADCDKFTLTTDAAAPILWSTGETTSSVVVSTAGSYFVAARIGCPARPQSNTIVIGTNPIKTWYKDNDKDGFGGTTILKQATQPTGFVLAGGDCNDKDATSYPGAPELADGKDNDCDGIVDNGLNCRTIYYQDADGDGFGTANIKIACVKPTGFATVTGDCNDKDNTVYPGAPELNDGKDNNCDGIIDNGIGCTLKNWYPDIDKDGFGAVTGIKVACMAPPGSWSLVSGDCNDKDASIYPGATEVIDGKDNNCNGSIDEGLACVLKNWYPDTDNDGYGVTSGVKVACNAPPGQWSLQPGDCDDKDNTVYVGAPELNDGKDNNCDGIIDNGLACTPVPWYQDFDKDGFGSTTVIRVACTAPVGFIATTGDCNDKDNTIYPNAPELLDGKDNDCDGLFDEGTGCTPQTWYQDIDKDGFGSNAAIIVSCVQPTGYITTTGDCNDKDATIYPNAPELADGKDNDCNGVVDDVSGTNCRTIWYQDFDKDGFGSITTILYACVQPVGYISVSGDCNDKDATIYPGAPELFDGKDNDCDGLKDEHCSLLAIESTNLKHAAPERFQINNKTSGTATPSKLPSDNDELRVSVYPNPANKELVVALEAFAPNEKMQISILQGDGKTHRTQTLTPNAKGQQLRYNVSALPSGIYILNVKQGSKQQSKTVVVNH